MKMPTVEFEGHTYSLTSRKTEIPDLAVMTRMEALIWLSRNTRGKGYQKPSHPLTGMNGAIKVN